MNDNNLELELNSCFKDSDALVIVALMFLSNKKNSLIPEIMSFFDLKMLKQFLYMYGGETIVIPSVKEFEFQLTCAIALYYKEVKNQRWCWIKKKLEIEDVNKFNRVKKACIHFFNNARDSDIDFLKNISN